MILGRRALRASRAVQPSPANNVVASGTYDRYNRGTSDLPPVIPNKEDHPIIQPDGTTHWKDIPKVRKGRRPSSVLTCLLKCHHPGIVDYDGAKVIATEWDHYHAVKDSNGHSVADTIEDAFWLRYKYEDEYSDIVKKHVRRCCEALLTNMFYYDRDEYLAQRQGWLGKEGWVAVVDEWCSPKWIAKSNKGRANRASSKYKPHKGGSISITNISQKMSEQTGEEGKPHGRWALFNGMVNDMDVIAEARANVVSPAVLKRRCVEQLEDELRMKDDQTRKSEAYANSLSTWGVNMYEHCQGTHKLFETLATNQGVPINEIPPPPIPPPARPPSPPTYRPPSTIHNLENNDELPALCAQQLEDSSYVNENIVTSDVPTHDPVPPVADEGMFGGFFNASGTDALNSSLVQSRTLCPTTSSAGAILWCIYL
ncbi:hypothetical protein ACQ4PT_033808 [Festuca glaucescens]